MIINILTNNENHCVLFVTIPQITLGFEQEEVIDDLVLTVLV